MWFLIRTGFWLSLVLLVLPLGNKEGDAKLSEIGVVDALVAARSAVADVSGFCERRAETCDAGRKVAGVVAVRAKEAARLAYLYLDDTDPEQTKLTDDTINTGSVN